MTCGRAEQYWAILFQCKGIQCVEKEKKKNAFLRSKDPLEWDVVERGINPNVASTSDKKKEVINKDVEEIDQAKITKRQAPDEVNLWHKVRKLSISNLNAR